MAKKAVISTGGKQYIVAEGETISIESLKETGKTVSFDTLLVIDGETVKVGAPTVEGSKVTADIVEAEVKSDKVTSIRYKAKKRVHTVRGHRQIQSVIKISKIS